MRKKKGGGDYSYDKHCKYGNSGRGGCGREAPRWADDPGLGAKSNWEASL